MDSVATSKPISPSPQTHQVIIKFVGETKLKEQVLWVTKPKWNSLLLHSRVSAFRLLTYTLSLDFLICDMVEWRLKPLTYGITSFCVWHQTMSLVLR